MFKLFFTINNKWYIYVLLYLWCYFMLYYTCWYFTNNVYIYIETDWTLTTFYLRLKYIENFEGTNLILRFIITRSSNALIWILFVLSPLINSKSIIIIITFITVILFLRFMKETQLNRIWFSEHHAIPAAELSQKNTKFRVWSNRIWVYPSDVTHVKVDSVFLHHTLPPQQPMEKTPQFLRPQKYGRHKYIITN